MKSCKNALFSMGVILSACPMGALAAEIAAGVGESPALYVSDSATLSDHVSLAEGSELLKTGSGTLTVEQNAVKDAPFRMSVLAGRVALTTGSQQGAVLPPAVIAEKAALWLDAAAPASLLAASGEALTLGAAPQGVARWMDRREAESPATYPYAVASNAHGTVAATLGPPQGFVTNGIAGVDCLGMHKGRYFDLYAATGKQTSFALYHVFMVHAVDRNWGYLLGKRAGDAEWYLEDGNKEIEYISHMMHFTTSVIGGSYTANWLLNGRWVDVFSTPPLKGTQLLEEHATDKLLNCNALYASKAQTSGGQTGSAWSVGGDRLHEIIFFTRRLTESEQQAIRDYLMRKWNLDYGYVNKASERRLGLYAQEFALAEGTTLSATPADGAETLPVSFSGAGCVVKEGAGTLALGPSPVAAFGGTFDLREGRVQTRGGRLPTVAAAGGDVIDASAKGDCWSVVAAVRTQNGAQLSIATNGAAGVVRKTGAETARLNALAADVSRLEVTAGELILEAPIAASRAPAAVTTDVVVQGTNMDFEASTTTAEWAIDTIVDGWWRHDSGSAFSTYETVKSWMLDMWPTIPQGTYCLTRATLANAYVPVTFPAAGTYEISFRHNARSWQKSCFGDRNRTVTDIGIKKYTSGSSLASYCGTLTRIATYRADVVPWPRMTFRFSVAEAGKYVLGFEGRHMKEDGEWLDNHVAVDDIKFKYVAAPTTRGEWAIPNGDFEQIPAGAFNRTGLYHTNQRTGWTFTQPDDLTAERIGVEEARPGGQFLSGDMLSQGNSQLHLVGTAGVAQTTFTPPAGTWRLRAAISRTTYAFGSAFGNSYTSSKPALEARVKVGEAAEASLGTRTARVHALTVDTWPTTFTTDGETPVTLFLQGSVATAGLVADDFALVAATGSSDAPELITNGGFETAGSAGNVATGWGTLSPCATRNGKYWVWTRDGANSNFAPDIFEGSWYMRIQQNYGVQQTIAFPEAGLYRLRFAIAPRPGYSFGYNAIRALLRKSSETTYASWREIGRAVPGANAWVEREILFKVPEAGSWVLAFEGMGYLQCASIKAGNDQSNCDHTSGIDGVSVRRVTETLAETPSIAEGLKPKVRVARHARLTLDYDGRIKVRSLHLDGMAVPHGVVKASDYPDYLGGRGEIEIEPKSFVILVK